jgi:U3 small nucleolar ribonucleoprotein component
LLEIEVALTGILALLGLHIILFWHYARSLISVLDEIAFPSDDPIMTSTLVDDEVFEYEKKENEKENNVLDGFAEMDELTVAEPEALEVFEYEEEPSMDKSKCLGTNIANRKGTFIFCLNLADMR